MEVTILPIDVISYLKILIVMMLAKAAILGRH